MPLNPTLPGVSRLRVPIGLAAIALWLTVAPQPAGAVDGVLEIHQTCAAGNGCFATDAAGFPVQIQSGGSYRLTSALSVPDANTTAILIDPGLGSVSLDLNGFTIRGVTVCSGLPPVCSGVGPGIGIDGALADHVTVRNGRVIGLGSAGIVLGADARVEAVAVSDNGGTGIVLGARGGVRHVVATENGGDGISLSAVGRAAESATSRNGGSGVAVGQGGVVVAVAAGSNAVDGISTGPGAIVESCSANDNGDDGIDTGPGSRVSASVGVANDVAGIRTQAGSQVAGSLAADNGGFGLVLGPAGSGYTASVIENNALGTVSGGTETGSNACNGAVSCP
jgi:hypothetical protein